MLDLHYCGSQSADLDLLREKGLLALVREVLTFRYARRPYLT